MAGINYPMGNNEMQTEMEDSFAWEEASIAEDNAEIEDSPSSSNDFC